ncbi:MAG: hypothetical protein LBB89_06245 [Treponema sp.]|jgi:hypothetical protein|nr:hypothetical protein [Treponema sp.]
MKKIICLFGMAIFGIAAIHAAPPVAVVEYFIGEWQGSAGEYDINIVLMHSNTCIITVKTEQDGREVTEDANGTWSCDEDIIRINGSFPHSKIKGFTRINWRSVYTFNNSDNSAFNMLVTPPGGSTQTRISFEKVMRWINE